MTNKGNICEANGRFLFLDIMKVIALILMPCIHAFNLIIGFGISGEQFPTEAVSMQMGFIYLIVPGVFMFCMGAGIVLSRKQTPKALLFRGLKLLLIGFVLNAVRASIYIWFGLLGEKDLFIEFWYWLWGSDILYFAGLYFLLFSLFRKLKLNDIAIAVISIAMLLISHIFMPVPVENETLVEIFGNFVYIDVDSCFPILSWSIFPTVGYLYMKYLLGSPKKTHYVAGASAVSILILGVTLGALLFTNNMQSRYYLWGEEGFMMDVPSAIIAISIAVIYASIIYGVSSLIKNGKVTSVIEKVSSNVNAIYCIHWVLITYLGFFWIIFSEYQIEKTIGIYFIGLLIFIVSTFLALTYKKLKTKSVDKEPLKNNFDN